jgi:hypothetical protein
MAAPAPVLAFAQILLRNSNVLEQNSRPIHVTVKAINVAVSW